MSGARISAEDAALTDQVVQLIVDQRQAAEDTRLQNTEVLQAGWPGSPAAPVRRLGGTSSRMDLPPMEATVLTPERLSEAAALTSRAFQDTPVYREMVPDPAKRQDFLLWLFERNFWLRLGSDSTRCIFDNRAGEAGGGERELVMFFMLVKPTTPRLTMWDMVRAGLLRGFLLHGITSMKRMIDIKAWLEEKERQVLGERIGSVARLERVTVLPSRQGQGIGTRALQAALNELDDLKLPTFLCTQEERNVTFYERLGFRVIADEICPIGQAFRNWMMLREPQQPTNIGSTR